MKLTKGQVGLLRRIDSRGREAMSRHYHIAEKLGKKKLIRGIWLKLTTEKGKAELKKREGRR